MLIGEDQNDGYAGQSKPDDECSGQDDTGHMRSLPLQIDSVRNDSVNTSILYHKSIEKSTKNRMFHVYNFINIL